MPVSDSAARAPLERDPANPPGAITAFLLPALVVYAALTVVPVLRTFYNSTHLVVPNKPSQWVGFSHYIALWNDFIFWKAVWNTLTWAVVAPVLEVAIATLLALCLYARVPFSRFLRVAWFTPVLMSYVVVGILWMWIYNYEWGPLNSLLRAGGLGGFAQPWLGLPSTALPSLIVVTTWMWTGFNMVVILAAMSSIPPEVLEAAELDNCGWLAKLWFVILPLIRPTLLNLVILSFIGKMKISISSGSPPRATRFGRPRRFRPTSTSAPSSGARSTSATPRPSPWSGSSSS